MQKEERWRDREQKRERGRERERACIPFTTDIILNFKTPVDCFELYNLTMNFYHYNMILKVSFKFFSLPFYYGNGVWMHALIFCFIYLFICTFFALDFFFIDLRDLLFIIIIIEVESFF